MMNEADLNPKQARGVCVCVWGGGEQNCSPPGFSQITFQMVQLAKQAYRYVNRILLTTFHDGDHVIQTKIVANLSIGTVLPEFSVLPTET